jgi:large-conductance mechanosensitive channel
MLPVAKVAKCVVQIAVGAVVGVAMNEFVDKHMNKPLQKFMDSMAEEKYKMDKEKIEKGL